MPEMIALDACRPGHLYRIRSRNLALGVFDGRGGFIGIRTKFGRRYLFTEYHWDTGAPYGTVTPLEDLGSVPEGIELREDFGPMDMGSRRPLVFDRPVSEGGRGWYFSDTGEDAPDVTPVREANRALFDWLDAHEARLAVGTCSACDGSGIQDPRRPMNRSGAQETCWTCGGTKRGRIPDPEPAG